MSLAIIGCGVVGLATASILNNVSKLMVDVRNVTIPEHIVNYKLVKSLPVVDTYILCIPTPKSLDSDVLDTTGIYSILDAIKHDCKVIIRSTLPIGTCANIIQEYSNIDLVYMPEFLREKSSIEDALSPDRVVYAGTLPEDLFSFDCEVIQTEYDEAEAIKLFSNAYLSVRLAFFREIYNLSETIGLSFPDIVKGVTMDKRIGDHYCDLPLTISGKCLPKDLECLSFQTKSTLLNACKKYIV